jgi:hypothetical protein
VSGQVTPHKCPRCTVVHTLAHRYCSACRKLYEAQRATEHATPRYSDRGPQQRRRDWSATGMECSKAPPPPPGFSERDLTTARPWA